MSHLITHFILLLLLLVNVLLNLSFSYHFDRLYFSYFSCYHYLTTPKSAIFSLSSSLHTIFWFFPIIISSFQPISSSSPSWSPAWSSLTPVFLEDIAQFYLIQAIDTWNYNFISISPFTGFVIHLINLSCAGLGLRVEFIIFLALMFSSVSLRYNCGGIYQFCLICYHFSINQIINSMIICYWNSIQIALFSVLMFFWVILFYALFWTYHHHHHHCHRYYFVIKYYYRFHDYYWY